MDLYLTDKSKRYYLEALEEVKNCKDDFWDLDEEIEGFLETINKNPLVQTIYSKYNSTGFTKESYLKFAYSKEVELKLFRTLIPELLICHSDNKNFAELLYTFSFPDKRDGVLEKDSRLKLRCVDDPDYFYINNIRVAFNSDHKEEHINFWKDISKKLSEIKK